MKELSVGEQLRRGSQARAGGAAARAAAAVPVKHGSPETRPPGPCHSKGCGRSGDVRGKGRLGVSQGEEGRGPRVREGGQGCEQARFPEDGLRTR